MNEKNGWEIGVHVDGASGAFVVPFLFPDLKFDFRLKNVVSINASGHKCAGTPKDRMILLLLHFIVLGGHTGHKTMRFAR